VEHLTGRKPKGLNLKVATCTLWAPACTTELFKTTYLPAIAAGRIGRFALFTLTDRVEQADNCADIYHKSLLYLVSNAFEDKPHIPLLRDGEPLLGLERFVRADPVVGRFFDSRKADWVLAPNSEPAGSPSASRAMTHGAFDDDVATLRATLARIVPNGPTAAIAIHRSASSQRVLRRGLTRAGT
jgi:hypothetical protein